jgi:hypothetical protein
MSDICPFAMSGRCQVSDIGIARAGEKMTERFSPRGPRPTLIVTRRCGSTIGAAIVTPPPADRSPGTPLWDSNRKSGARIFRRSLGTRTPVISMRDLAGAADDDGLQCAVAGGAGRRA